VIGVALSLLAALLHGLTSARYGYFRDELYFIACSKHLAWGYVDQPPLVATAAWLSAPSGYQLAGLRALPVLAAALTVYFAVEMARAAGGGQFARLVAGVATLLAPAYLLLGNVLTTTSFEPLSWTLAVYAAIRIVRARPGSESRWWVLLAITVAFGAYAKYSIALLCVALTAGLLATPHRRVLRSAWPLIATGVALALLAPNIIWQTLHGWPIVEVLRGDLAHRPGFQSGVALEFTDVARNAGAFAFEQILYTNAFAAPVWLAALVAPFTIPSLRDLRFVSVAYLVVFAAAIALAAKGYYIVGMYVSLFAIGAVAVERWVRWLGMTLLAALSLSGIVAMPFSLPVLSVAQLIGYTHRLGLTGRDGTPAHLVQPVFAEEFGWERLARDVAAVYFSLPVPVRMRTAIYADTYGDAGALDFFGPRYGLPPTISSQNTYYLWGTRGYDGNVLIAIGATRIDLLRRYYRSVTLVRTSSEPYKWVVEGPAPIYLCRLPVAPLSEIWPHLRWYGA
jgi:hypothetical protein